MLLSLGLGLGANTAIFTITNAVFLHSLPVPDPAGVLELCTVDDATQSSLATLNRSGISLPNIRDLQTRNGVFDGVAVFAQTGVTLTGFGNRHNRPETVLSYRLAERLFGSAKDAVGRTVNLSRWRGR